MAAGANPCYKTDTLLHCCKGIPKMTTAVLRHKFTCKGEKAVNRRVARAKLPEWMVRHSCRATGTARASIFSALGSTVQYLQEAETHDQGVSNS